ncbi:MAG: hypothetical protein ACR2G4_03190 [Pyrinomonadaceae bacterium]
MLDNFQIFLVALLQTPSPADTASINTSNFGSSLGYIFQGVTIVIIIGAAWKLASELSEIKADLKNNTTKITQLKDDLSGELSKLSGRIDKINGLKLMLKKYATT